VGRSGNWGYVECPSTEWVEITLSNQVIRLAFTSDLMKSGKYGVLSGSRTFTL
jgi:hypothetical protein